MKVYFLAGILLFCLLALENSGAAPLKTETEQDRLRKTMIKVGQDCKTSGFQAKDGSICLKLTVVAGVKVNLGLGYEEKDKKKNNEKGGNFDKYEGGKQKQGQQKILIKDGSRRNNRNK